MPELTTSWLRSLGYDMLNQAQLLAVLKEAYEALQLEVGGRLTRAMTETEMETWDSFDRLPAAIADERRYEWLQKHRPYHRNIVATVHAELELRLREIRREFDDLQDTWSPTVTEITTPAEDTRVTPTSSNGGSSNPSDESLPTAQPSNPPRPPSPHRES
ncbi:MAG: DUF5663 domain-containing protein [Propionibacteriaceae bacterium]|jgi:hypothetical protein|nr:DUF5663 domain-containing protein [Propionibacteriaceae bacterium]